MSTLKELSQTNFIKVSENTLDTLRCISQDIQDEDNDEYFLAALYASIFYDISSGLNLGRYEEDYLDSKDSGFYKFQKVLGRSLSPVIEFKDIVKELKLIIAQIVQDIALLFDYVTPPLIEGLSDVIIVETYERLMEKLKTNEKYIEYLESSFENA